MNPFARVVHYTRAIVDLARTSASRIGREQSLTAPITDPFLDAMWHTSDPNNDGVWRIGKIVYSWPYINSYRVLIDKEIELSCCKLANDGSQMSLGAKETAPLSPGDFVLVFKDSSMPFGIIAGSIPEDVKNGTKVYPDFVSQGSGSGFHRERHYQELLGILNSGGGARDFSDGSPVDSTSIDWGRVTDLGGMLHMDPFMGFFRMDEACGLFLFYHDQLARLAGYNLDIRSAIHETTYRNDEGEGYYYYGETPFPAEALGGLKSSPALSRNIDAIEAVYDKPYSTLESVHEDQQPFHRYREWGGYIARGRTREMVAPPANIDVNRYSVGKSSTDQSGMPIGLFREHIHLDGSYSLESAKQVLICKRNVIPVAKKKREPEDPKGDNPENYSAAGTYGSGGLDSHSVSQLGADGTLVVPLLIENLEAHALNKKVLNGFDLHAEDIDAEEHEDVKIREDWAPDFSVLKDEESIELPPSSSVDVGSGVGEVDVYQILSRIALLDDGGICIGDGYGSRIIMSGGNIRFQCAGDMVFESGRRVINMVGDDYVVKARNSIDLTSTKKDVRIKAEKNLQMLCNKGGVLIESKATGKEQDYERKIGERTVSSGVVLKCASGQVAALGQDVYIRSGIGLDPSVGQVVIDSGGGTSLLKLIAQDIHQIVENSVKSFFGGKEVKAGMSQSEHGVQMGGTLSVAEDIRSKGGITCQDGITVTKGHIQTSEAAGGNDKVNKLSGNASSGILEKLKAALEELKKQGQKSYDTFKEDFLDDKKLGSSNLHKHLSFNFRDEEQYGKFTMYQPAWLRIATTAAPTNDNYVSWPETELQRDDDKKFYGPFPGRNKWRAPLTKTSGNLFDETKGICAGRDSGAYEEAELTSSAGGSCRSEYKVIKQESDDEE